MHALQWCLRRLQELLAARTRAGAIRDLWTKRAWRRAHVSREVAPLITGLLGDLPQVWAGVCPVDRVRSCVSWCQLRVRELRQDMSRRSYKEWRARVSTVAKTGQRSAFQWLKRADTQDNDTCALGTFDQLAEQAGKWAEIWEARGGLNKEEIQHELDNAFGADLQALGRTPVPTTQNLTPAARRKVVTRFPRNTACPDGLPIWAVGLLSDGLLTALSRQIWCWEISGRLPSTEMLTLSLLIPKPTGGSDLSGCCGVLCEFGRVFVSGMRGSGSGLEAILDAMRMEGDGLGTPCGTRRRGFRPGKTDGTGPPQKSRLTSRSALITFHGAS